MKKLLFPLFILGLAACENKAPEIDYTLFSGTIENTKSEKIHLVNGETEYAIDLTDGTFSDTLRIENGYYDLYLGREKANLYLSNGGVLNLSIDAKKFDSSLTYTGSLAKENQLLADIVLIRAHHSGNVREVYSKEEQEFIPIIAKQVQEITSLINRSTVPVNFKEQQIRNNDYAAQKAYSNYEKYYPYFTKQEDFEVSADFTALKKDFPLDQENEFKNSEDYRAYVKNELDSEIGVVYEEEEDYQSAIIKASDKFTNPYIKEQLLDGFSNMLLSPKESLQSAYDFLIANTTSEKLKEKYTSSYEQLKKLAKGMPSPQFSDYENHKGGTTSLTDLKGKYTYIDVWATWCGPCIGEIPSLKAIEAEYHDKNIEFVSASIDREKDHDTWVNMVNDKELQGVQLMADNDWKSQFVQDYQIKGIPRFILVDPEGNIVSADAPRPSDPKLKELLAELNI